MSSPCHSGGVLHPDTVGVQTLTTRCVAIRSLKVLVRSGGLRANAAVFTPGSEASAPQPTCRFFTQPGGCRAAAACRFAHLVPRDKQCTPSATFPTTSSVDHSVHESRLVQTEADKRRLYNRSQHRFRRGAHSADRAERPSHGRRRPPQGQRAHEQARRWHAQEQQVYEQARRQRRAQILPRAPQGFMPLFLDKKKRNPKQRRPEAVSPADDHADEATSDAANALVGISDHHHEAASDAVRKRLLRYEQEEEQEQQQQAQRQMTQSLPDDSTDDEEFAEQVSVRLAADVAVQRQVLSNAGFHVMSAPRQKEHLEAMFAAMDHSSKPLWHRYIATGPEAVICWNSPNWRRLRPSLDGLFPGKSAGCNHTAQVSEALSYELLHGLFGASLLFSEMEIKYQHRQGVSKMDYCCSLLGFRVGVQVTRAVNHKTGVVTANDARRLLRKKIRGMHSSSRHVTQAFAWQRCLLHVWSCGPAATRVLHAEWARLMAKADPTVPEHTRPLLLVSEARFAVPLRVSYIFGSFR